LEAKTGSTGNVVCFEAGEFACGVVQPTGKIFLFAYVSRTKKKWTLF
jgi:hypothetical protein